jgi:hypothetical protein
MTILVQISPIKDSPPTVILGGQYLGPMTGPTSWWNRVREELRDEHGPARKMWWLTRFAFALATLGQGNFGIAALGDPDAKARRVVSKARSIADDASRGKSAPSTTGD